MDSTIGIPKPIQGEKSELESNFVISKVIDKYQDLLEELFLIRNPKYRYQKYQEAYELYLQSLSENLLKGVWFYFPWNETLIHYLPPMEHFELRTARNRNLITSDEQKKLFDASIAIAGLSVGSHAALTMSMMGFSNHLRLADPDTISGSNLNRIRYDFTLIGKSKCLHVAEQIYQMNPFADLKLFMSGIHTNDIENFFIEPKKIDIFVEEVDNLAMKIYLRLEARRLKIPVLMATDNGDGIIVDIERFDLEPDRPIFHGALGDIKASDVEKIQPSQIPRMASLVAGVDVVSPRMLNSLLEVGKTLYSWPQLGDAATLTGVAISYLCKRLILGDELRSGKYEINLDSIFDRDYDSPDHIKQRKEARDHFKNILDIP